MVTDIGTLIIQTPEVRAGRPRVAGTGVTVSRIVTLYKEGLNPEEIVEEFGHLNLAHIHAALAYYHANRDEIDNDLTAEDTEAQMLEHQHGHLPQHRT